MLLEELSKIRQGTFAVVNYSKSAGVAGVLRVWWMRSSESGSSLLFEIAVHAQAVSHAPGGRLPRLNSLGDGRPGFPWSSRVHGKDFLSLPEVSSPETWGKDAARRISRSSAAADTHAEKTGNLDPQCVPTPAPV